MVGRDDISRLILAFCFPSKSRGREQAVTFMMILQILSYKDLSYAMLC